MAIAVADLDDKDVVLAAGLPGFFAIPHFDGYPAVLVQLETVDELNLSDSLIDGWLACAPAELAADYLAREQQARLR